MTDPWEGIRHTLSVMPAQSLISDPIMGFLVADAKKLLADADALLALVEACRPLHEILRQQLRVTGEERLILEAFRTLPLYLQKGK